MHLQTISYRLVPIVVLSDHFKMVYFYSEEKRQKFQWLFRPLTLFNSSFLQPIYPEGGLPGPPTPSDLPKKLPLIFSIEVIKSQSRPMSHLKIKKIRPGGVSIWPPPQQNRDNKSFNNFVWNIDIVKTTTAIAL